MQLEDSDNDTISNLTDNKMKNMLVHSKIAGCQYKRNQEEIGYAI